jgi:hypothetical protein
MIHKELVEYAGEPRIIPNKNPMPPAMGRRKKNRIMKKLQILALLGSAALLCAAPPSRAGMLNGSYTNQMGDLAPLWDISGGYTNVADLFTSIYTLNQAASGKLTGDGTFSFVGTYDGIDYKLTNGVLKVGGALTGVGETQKVHITTAGSGTGTATYGGVALKITKFTEVSQFLGEVDKTSRQVAGTLTFSGAATFEDIATGKTKSASKTVTFKNVTFPLPTNATGDWTLTLDLAPKGMTIYSTGSGTVVTSAGNSASYNATAAYSAKTGASAILLTGTGESKGSSLSLKVTPTSTNLDIQALTGSLFGQSVQYKAP